MDRIVNWIVPMVVMYILVADFQSCASNSVPLNPNCMMPNYTIPWISSPESSVIDVHWVLDNICHTTVDCFGEEEASQRDQLGPSNAGIGDSVQIPEPSNTLVQLKPVQLQRGNKLRFHFHPIGHYYAYPFIYKVNETGFRLCDTSRGQVIRGDRIHHGVFELSGDALKPGYHYYIAANDDKMFISCDAGLKLNVTVKRETCAGNDVSACGGRGLCVTSRHQPAFACRCCGTYKGANCSVFDPCLSDPCQNGAECLLNDHDSRKYQCKCPIGFYGDNCEHKASSLCDLVKCQNNATCYGDATSFQCACLPGWTGSQCEVNTDDCASMPCRHGRCVDKLNGYQCLCYPGYYGADCEQRHGECTFGPCENGGFCENRTVGSEFRFACHCRPGWTGSDCSVETSACEPNPCSSHGVCMESKGDYECICQPGYGGEHCEVDINDCYPNPCMHKGQCLDLTSGHLCICAQSRGGRDCQYTLRRRNDRDGPNTVVIIHNDSGSNRTVTIVACVVTIGLVILTAVLVLIYCRLVRTGNGVFCLHIFGSRKDTSDLSMRVNANNVPDRPLTVCSFEGSQADLGVDNRAFKNELV